MKLFDLDKLINTLTGYVETKIELIKLEARENATTAITKLSILVILGLLGVFALHFLFLGLAALFNDLLDSSFLGHLIMAGFFALILCLVLVMRDKIAAGVRKKLEEEQEEEKDNGDV